LKSKEKANPLFVSPGNGISVDSAYNLAKELIKPPHKLPEPLHLAHKYVKSVKDELKIV
jgi:deoxyribonuclease V